MATLLAGVVPFPSGLRESAVFAVPGGIKQAGVPLNLKISLVADSFPNGTTNLTVFISLDGGASFRSASMSCVIPASFRGPAPHFWTMTFSLGANDQPTHVKFSTEAPSAFSTSATLEVL